MSSYIKFMFKYLFEPEALPAELLANGDGPATQRTAAAVAAATATGQVDVVFVLDSADGSISSSGQPPLVGPSQLPVNYSSSLFGPSSSDNMTRPHEASSSSSSSIMVNKSLVDAAVAGTRRLVSVSGRTAGQGWLQQQAEQLQSADSGGNSKLWPPNCLGFARMFAMAQNSQHNAGVANGTTTTTTTTTTMVSSSNNNSNGGGLLAARLGSFAEFEHLIRQQLAAVARGIGNSSASVGNSQRATRGITGSDASGAFYSQPLSSGGQQQGQQANSTGEPNLLRLLIRSIGHANATTTTTADQPRPETMMSTQQPTGLISSVAPNSLAAPQLEEQPAAVQVNSLELLECYNQLQLNDYYQGYDIFIGLRIASTLSILFIVFILFVIYKTGCRDGERTSRSQLRLTSSGGTGNGNADKSGSPLSSTSTNSLVSKQRRPNRGKRKGKEKYQQQQQRGKRQGKINSTRSSGGEIESQPLRDPYHRGSFAYTNARANTSCPLEARTNKDNQAASWSSLMNDESHIKQQQQLPSECHPSVMVVIEDDSSATATGLAQQ